MAKKYIVLVLLTVAVLFLASRFSPEFPAAPNEETATNTLPAIPAAPSGGLIVKDVAIGTGAAAKPGDTILVHYRGILTDGTIFDSSYDRGAPFEFTLGAGRVIRGWDEGLVGMKVGGKRMLTIPPELAYGSEGRNPIPPNATLIFEAELVAIRSR